MTNSAKIFYDAPAIASIDSLAKALSFTPNFLKDVARNPSKYYTVFSKNVKGKYRTLCEPQPALKILQKRIVSRIFCHLRFPSYLHGGIKAEVPRDFITNASSHARAETTLTLDIQNFFPSITASQVEHAFKKLFHFPAEVATLLANVVTLNGALPQGSPTSSYVANFVMWEREFRLYCSLTGKGLTYTRLIDDMTISSEKRLPQKEISRVINGVAAMLAAYNYHLHSKKKKIYSRSNPLDLMQVTGLWLNRGSPKLFKEKRQEISHEVIKVRRMALGPDGIYKSEYHIAHAAAYGRVLLLQRLKHARSARLKSILEKCTPEYDEYTREKIAGIVRRFCKKQAKKETVGHLKSYYKLQHYVGIIKRNDATLARELQNCLNKVRPKTTMREIYA